jgi:hypothetical protein
LLDNNRCNPIGVSGYTQSLIENRGLKHENRVTRNEIIKT